MVLCLAVACRYLLVFFCELLDDWTRLLSVTALAVFSVLFRGIPVV